MSPVEPGAIPAETTPAPPVFKWYHKALALLSILFCLEVGVVLLVLPWSEYWDNNYLSSFTASWQTIWSNPYLRGGVSGLGVVNILISFGELARLRRFRR